MELWAVFFFLVVGAAAHPEKRMIEDDTDKMKDDISFIALVRTTHDLFDFRHWAIIITENWLLSSFNYSHFKTFNISVEIYSDLLYSKSHKHEIDYIIERDPDEYDSSLYPAFELIKLKHPINFGDLRKPILLAGPNYELMENEEAKVYHLTSILSDEIQDPFAYFNVLSVKVILNAKMYTSELSSCLKSYKPEEVNPLECDPAILNGTLVGFSLRIDCENPLFLGMDTIYDWILMHVPELNEGKRTKLVEKITISVSVAEKELIVKRFLERLIGSQETKIADQVYINNVTVNVNGIMNNN